MIGVVDAKEAARTTPPSLGGKPCETLKARRVTPVPDHSRPRPDLVLAQALAADLDAADFRSDALRTLWGSEADDALARGLRSPILRALADRDDPLSTLGRFWVLGMPQALRVVERALPRTGIDGLVAMGLAAREDDRVAPLALITPQSFVDADGVGEWWIASDLDEGALGGALPADHVLGVGGASRTLAELVIPTPVERALDLGTGCGIQALLVSRHAGAVVATDISERALAYAELNAYLNGVRNIEFRLGSLFEPVAGESFDLIVSNPPFVITPRVAGVPAYEYRDGGLIGDALVERFLREVPTHLSPGGVAQLLGNWESSADVTGLDRVRSWVDDDLDAWVIQREELSPLGYAELWIRDGGTLPRDDEFTRLLTAWLDDFDHRGVTAVGFGYIVLRRPSAGAAVLRRFETAAQPVTDLGRALGRGLQAHDALAHGVPERLLVAPDVTEARHFMPGEDDPSVIELRQGGGFGRTVRVDPALAGLVGACDGELTVAQIVAALADLFEVPLADLWADLEPRLRELVLDGLLLPAE
ncbi:methyltransferase [Microbacterium esteraromaticum]|uniref:Methyltransferase n=1 Tax=Microbacterium esteraromaticum TaxID=57043 RepID=A0A939DUR4_9MICO|nr:methyltransferase [Microbacterium esteraromaticum]MBN8414831.1 methyltransferase [Microbacterium esteraromaticum]MBN8424894.1 methyltransferase [Microbacterium esteraromaticum]